MNTSELAIINQETQKNLGDTYLRFQLNQNTSAVLPVKHIQEAIVIPASAVTPMPNMPECILGLINWRSRICWIVDLLGVMYLNPLDNNHRQYSVVMIRVESVLLGLVVQTIKGTIKLVPDAIESPIGQVPPSLVPYLRGCIIQPSEILLVLDAQAIVHSSSLYSP